MNTTQNFYGRVTVRAPFLGNVEVTKNFNDEDTARRWYRTQIDKAAFFGISKVLVSEDPDGKNVVCEWSLLPSRNTMELI